MRMKSLCAGLLALALFTPPAALAGGALDSLLLSTPPVSITPIYQGPTRVQSAAGNNGVPGSFFIGTTAGTGQFQAGMLVFRP